MNKKQIAALNLASNIIVSEAQSEKPRTDFDRGHFAGLYRASVLIDRLIEREKNDKRKAVKSMGILGSKA